MDNRVTSLLGTGRHPASALATDGTFLAFCTPEAPAVSVVCLRDLDAPPLRLNDESQRRSATALTLGQGYLGSSDPSARHGGGGADEPPVLLVAGFRQSVVVWDVEAAYEAAADGVPLGLPYELMSGQGSVEAFAWDSHGRFLAVAAGDVVFVVELSTRQVSHRLEGHRQVVGAVSFCWHVPDLLVTAGDDRTFKIWDLKEGLMVYQSAILSAAPLTSIAMDPEFPRLAIGAADGVVRFYDISEAPRVRCMQTLDVGRGVERMLDAVEARLAESSAASRRQQEVKVITGKPSWHKHLVNDPGIPEPQPLSQQQGICGASGSIETMFYLLPGAAASETTELLREAPRLLLGSPRGLVSVDSHTYDMQTVLLTEGAVQSEHPPGALEETGLPVGVLDDVETSSGAAFGICRGQLVCALCSAFRPQVAVVELRPRPPPGVSSPGPGDFEESSSSASPLGDEADGQLPISIFPSGPPQEGSVLKVTVKEPTTPTDPKLSKSRSLRSPGPSRGKVDLRNQPVTFHTKVRSSGYGGLQPVQRLGQRPGAVPRSASSGSKGKQRGGSGSGKGGGSLQQREYPAGCAPIIHHQAKHCLAGGRPLHVGPVFRLAYSPDGTRLATASADKTARVIRLPLNRHQGDGTDLIGHNAGVTSVCWSFDGNMLLTASPDRSARLWNHARPDPLLNLTHVRRPPPPSAGKLPPTKGRENLPFNSEVRAARFLGLDQFIVLACQNRLHVYTFKLCDDPQDDISRLKNNHSYKLQGSLAAESQSIMDLACANSFFSHLVIASGSNRSIEVFDLSHGKAARVIPDAHSRPVHTVVLSNPPSSVSHPQEAYELFATASQDSDVRLWDLRASRCVRRFSGHSARQQACGIAFSPCLRYLAVGSEDKTLYKYDLRTGRLDHRIRATHGETVSDVSFHPVHPQLATACFDGHVRFFSDEDGAQ